MKFSFFYLISSCALGMELEKVDLLEIYEQLKFSNQSQISGFSKEYYEDLWKGCHSNSRPIYWGSYGKPVGDSLSCHHIRTDGLIFHSEKTPYKNAKQENDWNFSFCIVDNHLPKTEKILYIFHGITENAYDILQKTAIEALRLYWKKSSHSYEMPIMVSVSLGESWFLQGKGMSVRFTDVIMPYIEDFLLQRKGLAFKERMGLGISMGALNLLHLGMTHPQLFKRIALICPPVSIVNPYSSSEEMREYSRRTNSLMFLGSYLKKFFPREFFHRDYYSQIDPLLLGQKILNEKSPEFLIQNSSLDEFGFHEGGEILGMVMRSKNTKVRMEKLFGRHCMLEPQSLGSFLAGGIFEFDNFKSSIHNNF